MVGLGLQGRTAVVTGAGSGIGQAVALGLAAEGVSVEVWDVNPAGASHTVELIRSAGGSVRSTGVDVANAEDVEAAASALRSEGSPVSMLVNCAGILTFGTVLDESMDDWARVMSVNLIGTYNTIRSLAPLLIEQGRGSIVNTGSSFSAEASVFNTSGGSPAYIVSKAAVRALTRKAAIDLAPHAIRVNAVAPGTVDSPMHAENQELIAAEALTIPLGRLALPGDITGPVLFLASEASAYLTGQTIHVNGGRLMAG